MYVHDEILYQYLKKVENWCGNIWHTVSEKSRYKKYICTATYRKAAGNTGSFMYLWYKWYLVNIFSSFSAFSNFTRKNITLAIKFLWCFKEKTNSKSSFNSPHWDFRKSKLQN